MATPQSTATSAKVAATATASVAAESHATQQESSNGQKIMQPTEHHATNEANDKTGELTSPTSPPYPPYGGAGTSYIDPAQFATYDHEHHPHLHNGFESHETYAYVYPLSPQFSVQYYTDFGNGYHSFPGSPALHPQSPPVNPTSPPFSPTFQYQPAPPGAIIGGGMSLSPPAHAFVIPHSGQHHFPPLHISSPVLTGTGAVPGSPPHQFIQPLPAAFNSASDHLYAHTRQPSHQQEKQPVYHSHNIYVRGLSSTTTDESFLDLCSVYGKVTSSKAIIDQKTGECKGYGFAMFENTEDCQRAIEALNNSGLQASFARVGQESFSSRLRSLQDETSTNIYISNLPLDMTEQKLEQLFHPYKTISNRILRDPQSGISRGVGFARLADRSSAVAIIEMFNGQSVPGSSAPLQVRFADSPAQKKLKNQTARKRMIRPRDFQTMTGFPVRPMMPITPETMLGIAPVGISQPAVYYTDGHFVQYPQTLANATQPDQRTQNAGHPENDKAHVSQPVDEIEELSIAAEQKLAISTPPEQISVSHQQLEEEGK